MEIAWHVSWKEGTDLVKFLGEYVLYLLRRVRGCGDDCRHDNEMSIPLLQDILLVRLLLYDLDVYFKQGIGLDRSAILYNGLSSAGTLALTGNCSNG